jgi:hypothetical protein
MDRRRGASLGEPKAGAEIGASNMIELGDKDSTELGMLCRKYRRSKQSVRYKVERERVQDESRGVGGKRERRALPCKPAAGNFFFGAVWWSAVGGSIPPSTHLLDTPHWMVNSQDGIGGVS